MLEKIVNIFLIINKGYVEGFKAKAYEIEGDDETKIKFLKEKARTDYYSSYAFQAPQSRKGEFMKYNKFARLESQGKQYMLFEEIFQEFDLPENPLVCVTPVVDGKIIGE